MNVIFIRDFEPDDAAAVVEVQQTAGQAAQWQATDYVSLSREDDALILVARVRNTGPTIGFLAARIMGEEAELYNLVVEEMYRRQSVGRCLVQEFHRRLAAAGVLRVSCEVRASNMAALSLYRTFGYVRSGLRRNYYANNGEDALLLQCDLRAAAARAGRPPELARPAVMTKPEHRLL
jgi:ribosomal-protein-alanine N-acetyltransferase